MSFVSVNFYSPNFALTMQELTFLLHTVILLLWRSLCRYLVVFLISRDKKFILLLACFGLIFTRSLNFYQFLSLYFFYSPPSFSRSARAESNPEPGMFTNILHCKLKYIRVKRK